MKKLISIIIFLPILTLSGCSWIEQFMVVNESNQPIEITYSLEDPKEVFAIFNQVPDIYGLTKPGVINWNNKIEIIDLDSSLNKIHVQLPPNSILIFGSLTNDNYTNYKQYFINGRSFNLSEMTIKTISDTVAVVPETFDTYFKKKNGSISYVIK